MVRPEPGLAVAVRPDAGRLAALRAEAQRRVCDEPAIRPPGWTPLWKEALIDGVGRILAGRRLPGAWAPALEVPRFLHGQSQGVCDIFGADVLPQPDGNFFVQPLRDGDVAAVSRRIRPLHESMYWGAVEWVRYARRATSGRYHFRNPVMCGPFDIANYLLGTTRLMEWVSTETQRLHRLLDAVTPVVIGLMRAVRDAAGGTLHPLHFGCVSRMFDLCSECRSLVSAAVFEEYDAPRLRRIGEALGPYAIHSCGSWERTVPASVADPNLKGMNGQVRENDLSELCRLAAGRVVLSIGPSCHLPARYTWPDCGDFLRYVLNTVSAQDAVEIQIDEAQLALLDAWTCGSGQVVNPSQVSK